MQVASFMGNPVGIQKQILNRYLSILDLEPKSIYKYLPTAPLDLPTAPLDLPTAPLDLLSLSLLTGGNKQKSILL